jgi:hypothetical protein
VSVVAEVSIRDESEPVKEEGAYSIPFVSSESSPPLYQLRNILSRSFTQYSVPYYPSPLDHIVEITTDQLLIVLLQLVHVWRGVGLGVEVVR